MNKISDYSILDILQKAGVETKKAGSEIVCRCPFCKKDNNLKNHNCQVNVDKNNIFCFTDRKAYSRTELIKELNLYDALGIEEFDENKKFRQNFNEETTAETQETAIEELQDFKKTEKNDTKKEKEIVKETIYEFKNLAGETLYHKRRTDFNDKTKEIRYLDKPAEQKSILFGLETLADDVNLSYIFLAEGEKCCEILRDALADTEYALNTAVLSYHDVGDFNNTEDAAKDIILSKNIFIFKDNDTTGERNIKELTKSLRLSKSIKIVDFHDKSKGYDIADWIQDGGTIAESLEKYAKDYEKIDKYTDRRLIFEKIFEEPEPLRYVFEGFRVGNVGILGGSGGAGKSYVALALALSVADTSKKLNYLNLFENSQRGKAGYISLEDDLELLYHRTHNLINYFNIQPADELTKNIDILSLWGSDFSLTKKNKAENIINNENVDYLSEFCKDKNLVIIDTLRRLSDGLDENSSDDMSFLLKILEKISRNTGASILLNAHTGKFNYSDSGQGQNNIRGSAAIVDNSRFTMLLANKYITIDEGKDEYGKTKTRKEKQLWLSFEKVNAAKAPKSIQLEWNNLKIDGKTYSMLDLYEYGEEERYNNTKNNEKIEKVKIDIFERLTNSKKTKDDEKIFNDEDPSTWI